MKTVSWSQKMKRRRHKNEIISLQKMLEEEEGEEDEERVIQKIGLHPKSVMLYCAKTLSVFFDRCKDDIVYLDTTGSIVLKGKGQISPFYIYEVVVRHPTKGSSPLPVATYVTIDHTTASISYFLGSVVTDWIKQHGPKVKTRPVMIICDGSVVLLQSLSLNFCGVSLQELLSRYFLIVAGQCHWSSHPPQMLESCNEKCKGALQKTVSDVCVLMCLRFQT